MSCGAFIILKYWECLISAFEIKVVTAGSGSTFKPYVARVTADILNIRKGAGTNYPVVGTIKKNEAYTIVAECGGNGARKWGKLKSGAGYVSLDFMKKI